MLDSLSCVGPSDKKTLIDVIHTNSPYKHFSGGVVQIIVITASLLAFVIPVLLSSLLGLFTCLHDLADVDWTQTSVIPTVDDTLQLFSEPFSAINKHAPLRRLRIKGHHRPWFHHQLSALLMEETIAWKKTGLMRSSTVILG